MLNLDSESINELSDWKHIAEHYMYRRGYALVRNCEF